MKARFLVLFIMLGFLAALNHNESFGSEQIFITISSDRDAIIYDGKWTNVMEWERTSLDTISYEDGKIIILRTAHQGDFLYIFVDAINDFTLDIEQDSTTICVDGNNTKSKFTDKNDFCFTAILDKDSIVLQGTDDLSTSDFKQIENPSGFIGISSISDQNDRYITRLHPGYEFKIPIELFGRSDKYGFFLSTYDASIEKSYNWPTNITIANSSSIPPPLYWGELVSPDKSLPEFNMPVIIFISSMVLMIYLIRNRIQYGNKFSY